jgi:hypothetical protein
VVHVWDPHNGRERLQIQADKPDARLGIALTPDGKAVVTAHSRGQTIYAQEDGKAFTREQLDGEIRLWDLATGKPRGVFQATPRRGEFFPHISSDGITLAAIGAWSVKGGRTQYQVSLWDFHTGTITATCRSARGAPRTLRPVAKC